jgi:hypothetical protein
MEYDYSIETLVSTFASHAKAQEENLTKCREQYKKIYPADKDPEHLINPFNLSHSLTCICQEIVNIKKFIGLKIET